MEDQRERERIELGVHHKLEIDASRRATSRGFSRSSFTPRRSHPLAGRSNRQCADGLYVRLPLCTRFCSKGKAGPENVTTSKLQGALSPPRFDKSTHPKGKAGPENAPTSKFPGALTAPQKHRSTHPKGKADLESEPTSKLPGALPTPHQHKSSHPKGKAGPDHAPTSKLQGALPSQP